MSDITSPLKRDERMWCGARDGCIFEMIVGMAVFGATGGNPSGSRPNFFGRQHLTFDKGGKGVGGFRGIVRFLKRLWEWKGSVQQSLKVCDGLHCNRKNRVLCRTRFFLTVDILFRRYPLAVLLYCKVKMRCQL